MRSTTRFARSTCSRSPHCASQIGHDRFIHSMPRQSSPARRRKSTKSCARQRLVYAERVPAESGSPGKAAALGRIAVVYVVALAVLIAVFRTLEAHPLLVALAAMLAATGVTFAATLFWRNGSVFDAYWSVVPPFVAIELARISGLLETPL